MKRLLIIFDSCRYDSFEMANTEIIEQLDFKKLKAYTNCAGTSPSFYNFMYWNRLPTISTYEKLPINPKMNYVDYLADKGVKVRIYTSLPTLSLVDKMVRHIAERCESYKLFDPLHSAQKMMEDAEKHLYDDNTYTIIWLGETHAPYFYGEGNLNISEIVARDKKWVDMHVYKKYGEHLTQKQYDYLHDQQISAVEFLCQIIYPYLKKYDGEIILTADHGESLGEMGRFGHGVCSHPVEREVPLLFRGFTK